MKTIKTTCETGKIGYATREAANKVALKQSARLRRDHKPSGMGVYTCPHCNEWHLTSRKERT